MPPFADPTVKPFVHIHKPKHKFRGRDLRQILEVT